MPLVSRATIKSDWLNIAAVDNSKDAMIDRLIAYVDNEIKDMCQQPIAQETLTLSFGGSRSTLHHTTYTVPMTLTSLASRNNYGDAFVAVVGTTNVVDVGGDKVLYLSNGFTDLQYQAVLTAGYATVPDVIAVCAAEMVTELFNTTPFAPQANRFGVSAITESEAGISIGKTLLRMRDKVRPRLLPYMRIVI